MLSQLLHLKGIDTIALEKYSRGHVLTSDGLLFKGGDPRKR